MGPWSNVDGNKRSAKIDSPIQVAHSSMLSEEQAVAWLAHLERFEVDPLFRGSGGRTLRGEMARRAVGS